MASNLESIATANAHVGCITSMCFSTATWKFISCGADGSVLLHELEGSAIRSPPKCANQVRLQKSITSEAKHTLDLVTGCYTTYVTVLTYFLSAGRNLAGDSEKAIFRKYGSFARRRPSRNLRKAPGSQQQLTALVETVHALSLCFMVLFQGSSCASNEAATELEKLKRSEFVVDTEEESRILAEARAEIDRVFVVILPYANCVLLSSLSDSTCS